MGWIGRDLKGYPLPTAVDRAARQWITSRDGPSTAFLDSITESCLSLLHHNATSAVSGDFI